MLFYKPVTLIVFIGIGMVSIFLLTLLFRHIYYTINFVISHVKASKFKILQRKEQDYITKNIVQNNLKSLQVNNLSKRDFLISSIVGSVYLLLFSKPIRSIAQFPNKKDNQHANKIIPVSPPGSVSVNRLNDLCTGCSLCISACPTKVLRPSFLEYGIFRMMQPYLDFQKNFCEYDCIVCSNICPTGALKPLTVESKHLCQIGIAKFELKKCIVITEGVKCSRCANHCPVSAIQMVVYGNSLVPEVISSACIGCGECEFICPATPSRAIHVMSNTVHLLAIKPNKNKQVNQSNNFPF